MSVAGPVPTDIARAPRQEAAISGDRSRLRASSASDLFVDLSWIGFLILATGAGTRMGLSNGERLGWLVLDAVAVITIMRRPRFAAMVVRHWVLMSWGALACLSALWSLAPMVSIYHGLQLTMTIIAGLLLAASLELQRAVRIVFLTLLATAILSLGFNLVAPEQSTGWQGAWIGAFSHKNTLGTMMALLLILSFLLLLAERRPPIAAVGLVLALGLLALSRSGTAILSALVSLGAILPFILLRGRPHLLPIATGLFLVILSAGIAAIALLELDVAAIVLDSMGKDTTLTGRSLLWEFGVEAFLKRPWLGHGFKGYWESGSTTVQLLRYANGSDLWFFHNNFIEVAVAFGVLGPILLTVGIVWAMAVAVSLAARAESPLDLWPLAIVVLVVAQTLAENPLFYNHSTLQFLFVAAAAIAAERTRRSRGRSS